MAEFKFNDAVFLCRRSVEKTLQHYYKQSKESSKSRQQQTSSAKKMAQGASSSQNAQDARSDIDSASPERTGNTKQRQ